MGSADTTYLDVFKKERCHQNANTVPSWMKRTALIYPISQVRTFPSKEKAIAKPACDMYSEASTKIFECRRGQCDSIYLCGRCSLKIPEEDIIGHVADLKHKKLRRVVVNLGENAYNTISKQSFHSAFDTLKALNLHRNSVNKRPSTLTACERRVTPAAAAHRVQHVGSAMDLKDVDTASLADVKVVHKPITKMVKLPPNEAQAKTPSDDGFHAQQFNSRQRHTFKMSQNELKNIRLLPYSRGNGSKDVQPNTICKQAAAFPRIKRSFSVPTTSKCTKTPSTMTRPTSSATFSRAASLSIVPVFKPLERGGGTASYTKSASFNAARTTEVHKATGRSGPMSRLKNAPRCTETSAHFINAFKTKVASVATPEEPKLCSEMTAASKTAQEKGFTRPKATIVPHCKGNPQVAPHLKTTLSTASEYKEHSRIPAATKPNGNNPKVGLNQLIIVSWEGKQQVYCQLCSVRLKRSDHPLSFDHQYNYVKMKYPGWTVPDTELESKLNNIVTHLAEVEKSLGSQSAQKVEVKKDFYQKLAILPEHKAIEMVKAMMRPRDPRVSSSEDAAEGEVTSPCEVSSSNDVSGVPVPHGGMPVLLKGQLIQEPKTERQKLLEQITEMKSRLTAENDLALYRSVRGQSLDCDYPPTVEPIQDQLHSSITLDKKHSLPIPAASSKVEVIAEPIRHEAAHPHSEMMLVTHIPVTKLEKAEGSEQVVNPVGQKRKSDPAPYVPQKDLESKPKLTPSQIKSTNLEAATASTGQLDLSAQSPSAGPQESKTSQTVPATSIGRIIQGCSHLSIFLKASQQDAKPVIGMGLVWECRGISLETFFLCESCKEILSCRDICQHMVSLDHQLKYIWREHPEFLQMFWNDKDLPSYEKINIVNLIVKELSKREHFHKVDAQCMSLSKELHHFVKTSSFCEALTIVYNMKDENNRSITLPPTNTRHPSSQKPEDLHDLVLRDQVTQTFVTCQRSDSEAEQKTDMFPPEKTSTVGELELKSVSSCLDVKVDSVSSVPTVGTCLPCRETFSGPHLQPEFKPGLSQHPKSTSLLHVKQEEAFASASFATVCSTVSQDAEASLRNECPPSKKRPADAEEGPLPAKCISSPVQVKDEPSLLSISESSSVNPAVSSTPLSLKCMETEPSKNEPAVDWKLYSELIRVLKKSNFQTQMSPSGSVPDNPINSCTSSSSETLASRWDSQSVKAKSEAVMNKRRWDSKCLLVKATVRKMNTNSAEEMNTEAPTDSLMEPI